MQVCPTGAIRVVDDVVAFLLVDAGTSAATAEAMARTLRRLARLGLDLPAAADRATLERQGRRILAPMKAAGRVHPFNNAVRAMNHLGAYYGHPHPFKTARTRDPGIKPYTADEVAALMRYRNPGDRRVERRRRALIWWALHTGMRRSEIAALNVADLQPVSATFWLRHPAKGGNKRRLPVEREVFSPKRPLMAWLQVRHVPAGDPDALWTGLSCGGTAQRMTPRGLGKECVDISRATQTTFNFTRSRHHHATRLLQGGVNVRYIQAYLGHADLSTTARYADANPAEMMRTIHSASLPTIIKQGRPRRAQSGEGSNPKQTRK